MRRLRRSVVRRDHAEADEREHEDGQLEDERDPEDAERDEREVVARPDLDVEELLLVVRRGSRAPLGRRCSRRTAGRPAKSTVAKATKTATIRWECSSNGGRQEAPDLPEDDRQREREPGVEAHLDGREEGLGDPEGRERACRPGAARRARSGRGPGRRRRARSRRRRRRDDDQARPELVEVLDERDAIAVLEATR